MSDLIVKELRALNQKERGALRIILIALDTGALQKLDIQKLKGRADIYRLRKGKLRILFRRARDGELYILAIERRSDTTYR